jgi:hypothetical protein
MVSRSTSFAVFAALVALPMGRTTAQTYRFDGVADMDPQPVDTTDWFTSKNWGEAFGGTLLDPISPEIPDSGVRVEIQTSTFGVNAPEIHVGDALAQQVRIGREGGAGLLTMTGGTLTLNDATASNRFRVGSHDPENPSDPLETRNPGTFDMTGGTLTAPSLWVGSGSHGEMNFSGGTIVVNENLYMDWSFDANSILNVTGGTINVSGVMRMYRDSTFNFNGGELSITGTIELGSIDEEHPTPQTPNVSVTISDGIIVAGSSLRANGSVKLNGGILRAGSFQEFFSTAGSFKLNDGGTLQLRTSSESVAQVHTLISNGFIGTDSPQGTGAFQISVVNIAGTDFTQITLPDTGIDGDFDLDDDVDGVDFLIWQRGDRDATEYANWKANFGTANAVAGATGVPEPSSMIVALGLVLALRALPKTSKSCRYVEPTSGTW